MKYRYTDVHMINDIHIILDEPWEHFRMLNLERFHKFRTVNGDEVVINGNQIIIALPIEMED
ncbi:hypothetical protein HC141_01895 [Lactobacillus mulieris]|nr:hypothetical protein [Lactobacillus mulieris]